jgi:hypothetical protein
MAPFNGHMKLEITYTTHHPTLQLELQRKNNKAHRNFTSLLHGNENMAFPH